MKKFLLIVVISFAFIGFANAGINVNTASQSELETLQGIGPAKAKAIIEYREKNGPFVSKDDLQKVDGIGPGIIKQLRENITIDANIEPKVAVGQENETNAN
ncbi:MAG: ComEA family DNA-binding protein [Nitrosomonas sp.]|nr:ComEA family DNA-binding protein [Nitrosomonas sp.]MDP1950381.1 ComEA family DNA-binding protein [Nitrosomonas sp.]